MSKKLAAELLKAATLTFEEMGFLLPTSRGLTKSRGMPQRRRRECRLPRPLLGQVADGGSTEGLFPSSRQYAWRRGCAPLKVCNTTP